MCMPALPSFTYKTSTAPTGNLDSKAGVVFGYGDPAHPHAVTHINAELKYAYDANGNQVGRASDSLIYDAENRLIQVKKGETVLAIFVYNGDGERVKSILGGTTTAFVGNHLEWTGSIGTMKKYYYAGSQRVAVQNGMLAPPNYLLGDHLGSTSVTTNSAGNLVAEMLYKPFGEVRYTSGTTPTQYTYTGQYSNMAEIGLMYYNARWYDPYLNRWAQPDTIIPDPGNPQDWDRYSYVRNNPLKYTDPSGHLPVIVTAGIGALIGGIVGGAIYLTANQNTAVESEFWTAVAVGAVTGGLIGSGIGLAAVAASGTTLASVSTMLVGGGTAAAITETDYMISNPDEFQTEPFVESAVVSGVVGGISSGIPINPVGVAMKGFVYIAGAEGLYALQTDNWTVEGAQQAAVCGAVGATFDVGIGYLASETFTINTPLEKYDYSGRNPIWPQQDLVNTVQNQRISTSIVNTFSGFTSGIFAAYTIHKVMSPIAK